MSVDYKSVLDKKRNIFIQKRTEQEVAVAAWYKTISGMNPDVLIGIDIPVDCTLQKLIPELYEENPKVEVYREQLANANAMFAKVNKIAEAYDKEMLKCLSEYQALNSTQE